VEIAVNRSIISCGLKVNGKPGLEATSVPGLGPKKLAMFAVFERLAIAIRGDELA
jgi:hypothetical protein